MEDMKPKRRTVRRRTAVTFDDMPEGGSPEPAGPTGTVCGHGGTCVGPQCNVRYAGPTSHIRDHHVFHASRGISHIWLAVLVSGFALVITGAVAWTSVDAKENARIELTAKMDASKEEVNMMIVNRLDNLERALKEVRQVCTPPASLTVSSLPEAQEGQKLVKPVLKPKKAPLPVTPTDSATN